jgi:hypothetical protein
MSIIKIRSFAEKTYLPIFLAFLLTFVSCSKDFNNSIDKSIKLKSSTANMTGEEIFSGIFFFQGNLSNLIPSLKPIRDNIESLNAREPQIKVNLKSMSDEMIAIINNDYPNFFTEFKSKITSENLNLVKEALNNASVMYQSAALKSQRFIKQTAFIQYLSTNQSYINQIKTLDLNTEEGMASFKHLTNEQYKIQNGGEDPGALAVAVAGVYVAVGVVSYAAVAYSVVLVGALWVFAAAWAPIMPNNGGGGQEQFEVFVFELSQVV